VDSSDGPEIISGVASLVDEDGVDFVKRWRSCVRAETHLREVASYVAE